MTLIFSFLKFPCLTFIGPLLLNKRIKIPIYFRVIQNVKGIVSTFSKLFNRKAVDYDD